jgi:2'-5' RNA ligase
MSRPLFAALDLPRPTAEFLAGLDPELPRLRWIPAGELHLTLSFIGETGKEATDRLCEALDEVQVPPFYLPLQGVGTFSRKGQPTTIWVGVGGGHPHLFALHRQVLDAILKAGLEPDLRPFNPHVTIGRARGLSAQTIRPFLRKHAEGYFGTLPVEGFTLYSSLRRASGPVYSLVMEKSFE